ncbi:MAG TPA: excisionase family DNA-binding protein [Gaiellaceae bacterium]
MSANIHPHPRARVHDVELERVSIRPLLTKTSARVYLAVSERTLDRLVHDGELAAYRVRGQLRFRFDDIEAYLSARRVRVA